MVPFTTYPPGALGLDYVKPPVSEQRLADDGWQYVIRYIAQSTLIGKLVTPAEIARCHAAGLGMILNYESAADRAKLGATVGATDGRWSRGEAERLGYPPGAIILCSSFDSGIFYGSDAMARTAEQYARAFAAELGPYRFGAYAGSRVIDRIKDISALNWKPLATSWSTWPTTAVFHVRQRRPSTAETARMPYATASTVDVNVAQASIQAWMPHDVPQPPTPPDPPQPPPAPPGDDMTPVSFRAYDSRRSGVPFGPQKPAATIAIPLATPGKPVLVNLTVISVNGKPGYFSVAWDGQPPPTSAVQVRPEVMATNDNLCHSGTNPAGAIDVYLGGEPGCEAHLIVDVQGVAM